MHTESDIRLALVAYMIQRREAGAGADALHRIAAAADGEGLAALMKSVHGATESAGSTATTALPVTSGNQGLPRQGKSRE